MFPSWLMHVVQSYKGTRPRVSIAFNFLYLAIHQPREDS
ncbi:putative 2OG-Fe(II) oxygenase [Pseudomonas syringae]